LISILHKPDPLHESSSGSTCSTSAGARGEFKTVATGIDDIDRIPRTISVAADPLYLGPSGLKNFYQLFRITGSLDLKGVMRDTRGFFLRRVEKPNA